MIVRYESLRDDWIKGADLIARLVASSSKNGRILAGFPRQWIPIFINFDVNWRSTITPSAFISIASNLSEKQLVKICLKARQENALRSLVEAFAALDPLLADVLYRLDRRATIAEIGSAPYLPLTGWQSYGRPEVLALTNDVMSSAQRKSPVAVLLPCARKRPYEKSRTHRRIWGTLEREGITADAVDKIVVSSIGIVPEEFWRHPVVAAYDSGVPDIYRILRLMREFFRKAKYEMVIDCLEFRPYSDCLSIVMREGLVKAIQSSTQNRTRPLPRP